MTNLEIDLAALHARAAQHDRYIVGIAGPPGAGKSTLARQICHDLNQRYGDDAAALVPMDGFHLSNAQLQRLQLSSAKGAVPTFDVAGYLATLQRCRAGVDDIYVPDYSRVLHEPIAAALVVPTACRIVVTEGNYLLLNRGLWAQVRGLLNECWFIDAPDSLLQERLIARHSTGDRSLLDAQHWYESVDKPNIDLVRTTAAAADLLFTH